MGFKQLCEELTKDIQDAYEQGVTLEQAERLAAKFLGAQITVGEELRKCDLDARLKKSGLKAAKAAVYLDEATKDVKKPSDVMLGALVDSNELVLGEQKRLDEAEVLRDELQNYLNVFRDGHIYYRSLAKGRFE